MRAFPGGFQFPSFGGVPLLVDVMGGGYSVKLFAKISWIKTLDLNCFHHGFKSVTVKQVSHTENLIVNAQIRQKQSCFVISGDDLTKGIVGIPDMLLILFVFGHGKSPF